MGRSLNASNIKEGDDVYFECLIHANPPPSNIKWTRDVSTILVFCWYDCLTLTKTEIIYPKNVRAKVAMDFTQDKYSAPRTIEKIDILGAV